MKTAAPRKKTMSGTSVVSDTKLPRLLLFPVAILVPLVINPFGFNTYEVPKFVTLALIVLVLIGSKAYLALRSGRLVFNRTPLDLPWLAILGVGLSAAILSIDRSQSLIGREPRFDGWLTLLFFAAVFWFAFQAVISDRTLAAQLVEITVGIGFLVSLYAIIQHLGFDLLSWQRQTGRAFSSAGSAMHLGAYLSLIAPAGLGLFLQAKEPRRRLVLGGATFVILAAVFFSYSRAAWLGVAIAVIFLATTSFSDKRRLVSLAALISITLVVSVLVIRPLAGPGQFSAWQRLTTMVSPTAGNNAERLMAWEAAVKATAARPVLGWGQDTFGLVFPEYQPTEWARSGNERPMDKPHNWGLEVLFATGILGSSSFLWLLFVSGRRLYRGLKDIKKREADRSAGLTIICAALIAYLVQVFFGFNMVGVTPVFYLLLGAALALATRDNESKKISINFKPVNTIALLPLFIVGLALATLALRPLAADLYLRRGVDLIEAEQFTTAQAQLGQAARTMPFSDSYRRAWARSFLIEAQAKESPQLYAKAVERFNEAVSLSPRAAVTYENLGEAHLWAWQRLDLDTLAKARKSFKKFVALSPQNPRARFKLGYILALEERPRAALAQWRSAAELDPDYPALGTNMAIALIKIGERPAAKKLLLRALAKNPEDAKAAAIFEDLFKVENTGR